MTDKNINYNNTPPPQKKATHQRYSIKSENEKLCINSFPSFLHNGTCFKEAGWSTHHRSNLSHHFGDEFFSHKQLLSKRKNPKNIFLKFFYIFTQRSLSLGD